MRKFSVCCFTGQVSKNKRSKQKHSLEIEETEMAMANIEKCDVADYSQRIDDSEMTMRNIGKSDVADDSQRIEGSEMTRGSIGKNDVADDLKIEDQNMTSSPGITASVNSIILDHDFSEGLHSWNANNCIARVVTCVASNTKEAMYAVITNRKETWQGLEQDITEKISSGCKYSVSARVGVSELLRGSTEDVIATLKLEYENGDSSTSFMSIGRASVEKDKWVDLEGSFSLLKVPKGVIFYLEGPSPGVDLLVKSVVIRPRSARVSEIVDENMGGSSSNGDSRNIIQNYDFSLRLHSWHANHCFGFVVPSYASNGDEPGHFVVLVNRQESWQGLELDITSKISEGFSYIVSSRVGVSGLRSGKSEVKATLKLEYGNSKTNYLGVGRTLVGEDYWVDLKGKFSLSEIPQRVVLYFEGPAPEIDLLIKSVTIVCSEIESTPCIVVEEESVTLNPKFEDGLNNWTGRGCKIAINESMGEGKILPQSGKCFASTTERTQNWNGIQQEITGRVERKLAYEVTSVVRIFGKDVKSSDIRATLWVQTPDQREQYIGIANIQATDKDWTLLQGKFLLNNSPSKVVVYLEGPPAGTDILVNSFVVKHAQKSPPLPPPIIENPRYGVNILENSNLASGTKGWFSLGSCALNVKYGSPHIMPPAARESLGPHEALSGRLIHVANRSQTWMGPAQMITDKVKLFLTYQVSGWVRIGPTLPASLGPQNVNVALGVDSQWVNAGQVEVGDDRWHEISGCFRIEKQAEKVMVYVQGPASGVDFMLAGLQIFAVNRPERFKHLKRQTDLIRKRDVVLKFSGVEPGTIPSAFVKIKQSKNSFPIGSCISRSNIDNEDFVKFFTKNFNWAVFGNELKWYWTESQRGILNYKDSDELVSFCESNNISARGHCIFWEVEATVQPWVRSLTTTELSAAVQSRLDSLLSRYKGKFKHYDVNNEMLHGSFYRDRLGKDARAEMFKSAARIDPEPILFVNDYHVEDGCDPKSCPEKYVDHIMGLVEEGASIGGVGIQGHIEAPVGPVVCSALDRLGALGIPIWFTEMDVSSKNEYVRADDLEVMLREAYAHPAVEGVMLWGFWELFMSRPDSHLVDAEGEVNEAGKRFLRLKKEWLSSAHGHVGEDCEFGFRGFHGTYVVEVKVGSKKVVKTFSVEKGEPDDDQPLVITLDL